MKHLTFLLALIASTTFAQCISTEFEYDPAGNRIKRTRVDLTASCSRKGVADTATEKISETKRMVLFPNPVAEMLNIHLVGDWKNEESKLWIYDLAGKEVYTKKQLDIENQLPFAQMPIGAYIVKVWIDNKYYEYKVIKE